MSSKINNSNKPFKWLAISSQFTATVVGFVLIGYFLDDYFRVEKNYLTLVASLLGVAVGFYLLFKAIKSIDK